MQRKTINDTVNEISAHISITYNGVTVGSRTTFGALRDDDGSHFTFLMMPDDEIEDLVTLKPAARRRPGPNCAQIGSFVRSYKSLLSDLEAVVNHKKP